MKYSSSSSNKDNVRKPYQMKDDTSINIVEIKNQDNSCGRKLNKDTYPLHIPPNWMFEYYLEKDIFKRIQGKEYGSNDEKLIWYRGNLFCKYHHVKVYSTTSCYTMRNILKQLVDKETISYENDVI